MSAPNMADRPIIFSVPMVRALLEGRKTQTRRIVKPQSSKPFCGISTDGVKWWTNDDEAGVIEPLRVPYAVGYMLWVRETWGVGTRPCPVNGWRDGIEYRADDDGSGGVLPLRSVDADLSEIKIGWHPSIHMFRWASRITLRVTEVRVQRLQEISEEDARAEGCPVTWDGKPYDPPKSDSWQGYGRYSFCLLWNSINGPGAWEANPWVAAISFTVERRNIDA